MAMRTMVHWGPHSCGRLQPGEEAGGGERRRRGNFVDEVISPVNRGVRAAWNPLGPRWGRDIEDAMSLGPRWDRSVCAHATDRATSSSRGVRRWVNCRAGSAIGDQRGASGRRTVRDDAMDSCYGLRLAPVLGEGRFCSSFNLALPGERRRTRHAPGNYGHRFPQLNDTEPETSSLVSRSCDVSPNPTHPSNFEP